MWKLVSIFHIATNALDSRDVENGTMTVLETFIFHIATNETDSRDVETCDKRASECRPSRTAIRQYQKRELSKLRLKRVMLALRGPSRFRKNCNAGNQNIS